MRWDQVDDGWLLYALGEELARFGPIGPRGAAVTCAAGHVTLSRVGFVRPRVLLRKDGVQLASFTQDFSGHGRVDLADGTCLDFDRISLAGGEAVLLDAARRWVVHVARDPEGDARGATLTVDRAVEVHRAVLLAVIAWHALLADLEDPGRPLSVWNGPAERVHPRSRFEAL